MRRTATTTIALALLLSGAVAARQVPPLSLKEHVKLCPLIVIGSIDSLEGRKPSPIGGTRYVWNSELHIKKVLKGTPPRKLKVQWVETWIHDAPEYVPGTQMIWLLRKDEKGTFYASRFDSTLDLNVKPELEEVLKDEKPTLPN